MSLKLDKDKLYKPVDSSRVPYITREIELEYEFHPGASYDSSGCRPPLAGQAPSAGGLSLRGNQRKPSG